MPPTVASPAKTRIEFRNITVLLSAKVRNVVNNAGPKRKQGTAVQTARRGNTNPPSSRLFLEDFDFNEKAVVLFGEARIGKIRPVLPVKTPGSLQHLLADIEHEVRRLGTGLVLDVESA